MQTITTLAYTLPELKEHIGDSAYERALDKMRESESYCYEYEDPFACGIGNDCLLEKNLPITIKGKVSIDSLSDNPIGCEIDWKETSWDFTNNVLSFLNDDVARKIARIMRALDCDLHEFLAFGKGYYSRSSILEPHYLYRANSRTRRIDSVIFDVVDVIDHWLREVEHFIAQDYTANVEYTYSEENIVEIAAINGYRFSESGELL